MNGRRVRSHIKINQIDSIMGIDEGKTTEYTFTQAHTHIHNNVIKKGDTKKKKMVYSTVIKIYAANVRTIGRKRQSDRKKKIKKEITLRTSFFIDKISIRKNRH